MGSLRNFVGSFAPRRTAGLVLRLNFTQRYFTRWLESLGESFRRLMIHATGKYSYERNKRTRLVFLNNTGEERRDDWSITRLVDTDVSQQRDKQDLTHDETGRRMQRVPPFALFWRRDPPGLHLRRNRRVFARGFVIADQLMPAKAESREEICIVRFR